MVDDACLSQVNSLKEPGLHLECVVHRDRTIFLGDYLFFYDEHVLILFIYYVQCVGVCAIIFYSHAAYGPNRKWERCTGRGGRPCN